MTASAGRREQALVFGEVADQYDTYRPSYPDSVFDTIVEYGSLRPGDRALEIGAGTGKATMPFVARGLRVHALEPSPGMAEVLRAKGVDAEAVRFDDAVVDRDFSLVFAAQAWHWVTAEDRYDRVAAALVPGGVIAAFWNEAQEWEGELAAAINAEYERYAPHLTRAARPWELDRTLDQLAAHPDFGDPEKRTVTWTQRYTTSEYVKLLETHSDHRVMEPETRDAFHAAVTAVIDDLGGAVDIIYDANVYLAARR